MATTYLSRSVSSTGDRQKATFSVWIKKSADATNANVVLQEFTDGTNYFQIHFPNTDQLQVYEEVGGTPVCQVKTNRLFRDPSGFYNIVVAIDTTQGASADRVKVYVNGVQETSFATATYPTSSLNMNMNVSGNTQYIGASYGPTNFINAVMSAVTWIDGTQEAVTVFGATDATTGEWKFGSPSATYGTNGFLILNNGNTITDQSTNSNDFTLGAGTLTNTEDCPSDVFATLNPLIKFNSSYSVVLSKGNTTLNTSTGSTNSNPTPATLGMVTGKYYWETKFEEDLGSGTAYPLTGIMGQNPSVEGNYLGGYNDSYGYAGWNGTVYNNGGSTGNTAGLSVYTEGDILSIALDADNNRLYIYKNGVIQNSGTGIVIPSASTTALGAWFPAAGDWGDSTHVWSCNFGNGYFGSTAIASAGTNASNIGVFEYDVPTGYTALSTKGLNN